MNEIDVAKQPWNDRNVLGDGDMSHGDYVKQLTYLLFLKMADERNRLPYNQPRSRTVQLAPPYQERRRRAFRTRTPHT